LLEIGGLADRQCVLYRGGQPGLSGAELRAFADQLLFPDFRQARHS